MTNLAFASILASTLALTPCAPPILPFTELSDAKIRVALEHMVESNEVTLQDFNVVLQLDHIRWKYGQMREALYSAAKGAEEGQIVSAKDLGKMFDTIDSALDAEREKILQSNAKKIEEERKVNIPPKFKNEV